MDGQAAGEAGAERTSRCPALGPLRDHLSGRRHSHRPARRSCCCRSSRSLAGLQAGAADPEFTVEANPGTIDARLLGRCASAGVTRVSLGVQSFAPGCARCLGRRHRAERYDEAYATCGRRWPRADRAIGGLEARRVSTGAAAGAGLREWNLDLVFGIPGQTWERAAADIDAAVGGRAHPISLYDLTYTPAFARPGGEDGAAPAPAGGRRLRRGVPARPPPPGWKPPATSATRSPTSRCPATNAGTTWPTGGARTTSASGGGGLHGRRRAAHQPALGRRLPGRRAAARSRCFPAQTRLWEKAMLGLRTAEGVDEAEVLPVLDRAARDRLLAQGCLRESAMVDFA